jgi:GNAT superfamily N-acetyltransferase
MTDSEITFRPATLEDCEIILHHRREMFRDMGTGTSEELDHMVNAARPWLKRALTEGSYRGWLAQDHDGRVLSGGGILISSWPPRPEDVGDRRAVIVNVFTESEARRKGLARKLMSVMIDWLREENFSSVVLHASDDGRALYESLGFLPTNEMRLHLN